jgi:hypothetical protein
MGLVSPANHWEDIMGFRVLAAAAMTSLLALALPALAQEGMRTIGTVKYEPEPSALEKDVFNIDREDRRIRSMRIVAERGEADVRSLRVMYEDGDIETVRVRQVLREGQRSAAFALDEPKPIRSIEISYVPRGTVVLALQAETRRPPRPPEALKWVEIGCKSVGLLGDRDVLPVDTRDVYRALRLRSANYDVEMAEMTVRYNNGQRDNYIIRQLIPSGGRIGPIDLRGERRRISQLDFIYRSRTIGPYKTKLCVDGLRYDPNYDD